MSNELKKLRGNEGEITIAETVRNAIRPTFYGIAAVLALIIAARTKGTTAIEDR